MKPCVEPAAAPHAPVLAALQRECFPDDAWGETAIRDLFALPRLFACIARVEQAPTGFALALDLGGECEILSLGVALAARRRGTGRALVEYLCAAAQRRNAAALYLEVAENNTAARALYRSAGFVCVGCRRGYYRQNGAAVAALVLRCPVTAPPST